jgi:sterol desaturase/sphingolipid hydroxylase (fatty acid hydroxylase superfamily)
MAMPTDDLLGRGLALLGLLADQFRKVLAFPLDPEQRIYGLYLLTSLLFAALVYLKTRPADAPGARRSLGSFVRFVFPRETWSSPSAWLDVRYFFFHQTIRLVFHGPLLVLTTGIVYYLATTLLQGQAPPARAPDTGHDLVPALAYAAVSMVVLDFVSFLIHYAQHKSALLWEFHKVHHSATVMHPLSNYREHPVDNIAYAIGMAVAAGLIGSASVAWLGYIPSVPTVAGAGLFGFVFNVLAYNLRHSHVWLAWNPAFLNKVFGSPALHQVHHSWHPDHIDRNFAFMFPVWDVIFGTYCLPRTNADVRFGLNGREEAEYRSCLGLYFLPLRKAIARLAPSVPAAPRAK